MSAPPADAPPADAPPADAPPLTRVELRVFAVSAPVAVAVAALLCVLVVRRLVELGGPWTVLAYVVGALVVQFSLIGWLMSWTVYSNLPFRKARR